MRKGTLWSATVADGQQGWFEIQMERSPDGWDWVINHDRRFWGQESTPRAGKDRSGGAVRANGSAFYTVRDPPVYRK